MVMKTKITRNLRNPRRSRQGAALLMCLFMVFMVSSLVLNIVATETLQLAAARNTIEYEQSLYWANAGVHHACSLLASDPTWPVTEGTIPPSSPAAGYSVSATADVSGYVTVISTGYSGRGKTTVQATIEDLEE